MPADYLARVLQKYLMRHSHKQFKLSWTLETLFVYFYWLITAKSFSLLFFF